MVGGVLWLFVIVLGRPPGPPLAECFRVAQVLGRDGSLAGKLVLGPHLLPPRWSGDGEGAESITQSLCVSKGRKYPFSPPSVSHCRLPVGLMAAFRAPDLVSPDS